METIGKKIRKGNVTVTILSPEESRRKYGNLSLIIVGNAATEMRRHAVKPPVQSLKPQSDEKTDEQKGSKR